MFNLFKKPKNKTTKSEDIVVKKDSTPVIEKNKITEKEIEERFEKVLRNFFLIHKKEYFVRDLYNFDLKRYFDNLSLYDFEVDIEQEFFESKDSIPDGMLKNNREYLEYIKKRLIHEN
jgi:hypothetical protein